MALDENDIRTELLRVRRLMTEASRLPPYHLNVTFGDLKDETE